jgi:hypothetical protein
MSEPVQFILRDWAGRKRTPGIHYGESEAIPTDDPQSACEPIPQFAYLDAIPPGRWGPCTDTRTLPISSPHVGKPPILSQASDETPEYSDIDPDDSDDDDLDVTLPLQPEMTSRHSALHVDLLNTEDLTGAQLELLRQACQEGADYHEQVRAVATKLREHTPVMTWARIGRIFGLSGGTIFRHMTEERWTGRPRGRPPSVSPAELVALRQYLKDQYSDKTPASYADISDFILIETGKCIPIDTIRHLMARFPGFKTVVGLPFEAERVKSDPAAIDAYFDRLARILVDFPAEMVINLDETGHCEWVDARSEIVLVPDDFPDTKIPIPVQRQSTRSTLLGAITAGGSHLRPLVIIHRDTIETELYECGFTPDRAYYRTQENAFITSELFFDWAEKVLFPYFDETRQRLQYHGPGLIILDGCTAHSHDAFLDECTWRGIECIFLPPHSSDQVQPLDLGIFGLQKAEASRCRPHRGLNPQSAKCMRMLDGYQKATCPDNITAAFRRAGIITEWSPAKGALIAKVRRELATEVRHWQFTKTRLRSGECPISDNGCSGHDQIPRCTGHAG